MKNIRAGLSEPEFITLIFMELTLTFARTITAARYFKKSHLKFDPDSLITK
jgi:hypothetical protein